jgi:hypothetical protein
MLDPGHEPPKDKKGLGTNIVAAVLLTILAIPVLFIATCVPAGLIMVAIPYPTLVIGVIVAASAAFCAALAYHAEYPGKRIGFIVAAIEIVAFGTYVLIYWR